MTRLVLDASVAVAWCFEDEQTPYTEKVLDILTDGAEALVPPAWPIEVANALLVAERRGRITVVQTARFLERLMRFVIVPEPAVLQVAFHRALPQAREFGWAAYDASYLEMALRLGLPLATIDTQLKKAASKAGALFT